MGNGWRATSSEVAAHRKPRSYCLLPTAFCLLLSTFCLLPSVVHGSWARQESGTLAWLRAVYFVDAQHGWAVGGKGALLATKDGGAHWQAQRKPTEDSLRDVFFVNEQVGWLVCERSMFDQHKLDDRRAYLLKTETGGASWRHIEATGSDLETVLVRIIFADEQHGWTFGEEGALYATTDGGATWTRQRVPTRHLLLGGTFLDQTQGWLVGAGATTLFTTDGGAEWRASNALADAGARLNAVTFADARHGWAVGARGVILTTANGGRSWSVQTSGSDADLFDVKFFDASEGWAAGTDGTLLHTNDGGAHWLSEPSPARHPLERLCFVSRARGWAVGFGGTIIAYTNDAGAPPVLNKRP